MYNETNQYYLMKWIVIAKNLRLCTGCHNATKLMSKVGNRKIYQSVRDENSWNIFENGKCLCDDYF